MDSIGYLIPISLGLGLIALGAFLWSLGGEQYADMEGAASRILVEEDAPALDRSRAATSRRTVGIDEGAQFCRLLDPGPDHAGKAPRGGAAQEIA